MVSVFAIELVIINFGLNTKQPPITSILQYVIRMSQDVSQLCHKICHENVVRADGFTKYVAELGSIPKVTLDKAGPIWGLF